MNKLFDPATEIMENWCAAPDNKPEAKLPNLRVWFDKESGRLKKAEVMDPPIVFPMTVACPVLKKGERYVGVIISADGTMRHHIILLPGEVENGTWKDSMAWAESIGGELFDRCEGALLFATLKDEFKAEWYWTREQYASDGAYAWTQGFGTGCQGTSRKDRQLRARAVRRLVIE